VPASRGDWALRLARNVLLWIVPLWALWALLTPFYNRFVAVSAENLLRLSERPAVTRLHGVDAHYVVPSRSDFPAGRSNVNYRIRVTDIHYHLILLGALFLAVPGMPWRQRLGNLGVASLPAVFFHIVDLFLWVKFVYATQLGAWSSRNYGPFAQNFWGLSKHLFDLPFKLALPLGLWLAFHFRDLAPRPAAVEGAAPPAPPRARGD
jgi:hypothetical protein